MSRTTKRLALTMALAVTVATVTAIVAVSASDGRHAVNADSSRRDDGRDSDRCTRRQRDTDDDERHRGTSTTPTGQLLPSFLVGLAPTTFLKVDRVGRIVEAATNTSCRPTPGDTVFVFLTNGTIIDAPYLDLRAIEWKGTFRDPGVFHRQRGQRGCLQPTPCRSDHR